MISVCIKSQSCGLLPETWTEKGLLYGQRILQNGLGQRVHTAAVNPDLPQLNVWLYVPTCSNWLGGGPNAMREARAADRVAVQEQRRVTQ